MNLVSTRKSAWAALVVIGAMLTFGSASALAQDATPEASVEAAHPMHIHAGSCEALGEVVYPLTDVVTYSITNSFSFGPEATADAGATPMPSVTATETTPVLFSATHIDATIAELIVGGFAINVHESAENIQNYIACGNIPACAGVACPAVTGVALQLTPLNESGYFGVARIEAAAEGGTNVAVFLYHLEMPPMS